MALQELIYKKIKQVGKYVSMWNFKTPGIPDEHFERAEKVPITKEEVRTIQISKARLNLVKLFMILVVVVVQFLLSSQFKLNLVVKF